ncbi:metallophosphoesterase family protein [Fibrella sp. HMF5335]|uniref:Phosphoesterase n=1 Tax=Fibrella rubiginis TaxID=2817060 RepID=A0A939GGE6_9BACT|nr:metallophosphoesterase family protein [Fibrella rubiginis]MBO0936017.1 metallophosphoesterase family protein [Fibrella rubiginis]
MRIGLLSDTHSYLDPAVFDHFAECDEIWHAGDVGLDTVAQQLTQFKPLRLVSGNIDDPQAYPENLRFEVGGVRVWMTHIGGKPPRYNPTVRPQLLANPPDLFVCGHSHILQVMRDPTNKRLLFINPGAAGKTGFHLMRTCVRFTLHEGRISDMQVIELGKR